MPRLPAVLCLLLVAAPAAAQTGADVVEAWQRTWRAAAETVDAIAMQEEAVRVVAGPRGTTRVETAGRLRYAPGERAARRIERAAVNGEAVAPERLPALDRRLARALGPPGWRLAQPPPSPDGLLARATARSLRADVLDGEPTWRVELELDRPAEGPRERPRRRSRPGADPPDRRASHRPPRATAWFSPSAEAPRLMRLRLPAGPGGEVVVDYVQADGLDLPSALHASVALRQQRRLRDYAVTATHQARYTDHVVARR